MSNPNPNPNRNPDPYPNLNPSPGQALRYAEEELRPAGWRVVSAVMLREPMRHMASWYHFDGP